MAETETEKTGFTFKTLEPELPSKVETASDALVD
ncbi:hypothetical protein C1Y40_04635 [Mycobacterium talmoniae]|uniref:Uncharacterized protein n=1 Tax=Mycobacterium talmoniae TaxID=1858794 RepID=A0A2S8BEZ8_9MYCO|nr:hypothetical protein C1Y40_04635 [Mycobacterium talmoniae]